MVGSEKLRGVCSGQSKSLALIPSTHGCLPPAWEKVPLDSGPEGSAHLLPSCLILTFTEFLQGSIVVSVKFSCYMLFCGVITEFKREEILKAPRIPLTQPNVSSGYEPGHRAVLAAGSKPKLPRGWQVTGAVRGAPCQH